MHKMMTALMVSLLATACGTSVTAFPLSSPSVDVRPRHGRDVEVFAAQPPQRPFEEIALLEAQEYELSFDSREDVLEELRARAGEMGCDAIVLLGDNDRTVDDVNGHLKTLEGYRASCIVYVDPPPGVAARQ